MGNDIKPFFLANRTCFSEDTLEVNCKFTGTMHARVSVANANHVERAIQACVHARSAMKSLAPYQRQRILSQCTVEFERRRAELVETLRIEGGKPQRDSNNEVDRLIDTFQIAAEEAVRIDGEILSIERNARSVGYHCYVKRVPIGACSFISPFNFPLNLVAHKIAPAIAAGCPFVLKPASYTPLSALIIGEVLAQTELPAGSFSILPCSRQVAQPLTTDPRFQLLSFTGSPEVGWALKERAGRKKVILELGGNAACVIDETADKNDAIERLMIGIFAQSGQSCISVQRILIHSSIFTEMRDRLIARVASLKFGDPRDPSIDVGPVISEGDARRLEHWIASAVSRGATILCGGKRNGSLVEPTLLTNVPRDEAIYCQEAFGPIAVLSSFESFDDAIQEVNDSEFGLQAGIFTRDIQRAMAAFDALDVGGVVIGDVPAWRSDRMPYGGVKSSGLGREGVKYAIEDMSELKAMIVRMVKP